MFLGINNILINKKSILLKRIFFIFAMNLLELNMKWILFIVALLIANIAITKEVPKDKIIDYSIEFMQNISSEKSNIQIEELYSINNEKQIGLYHIINFGKSGYVIMSADDKVEPILAYSIKNIFDFSKIPPHVASLLDSYQKQIEFAVNNDNIKKHPNWVLIENIGIKSQNLEKAVSPIISVNWDQGAGWNRFCPEDEDGPDGHVYVGCVAVAMAQAMSVYEYPNEGNFNNIENTTYEWDLMQANSPDDYNSLLLYHCAVSVNMQFGPDGSGAFTSDVPEAMKKHFDYSLSTRFSNSTSDEAWTERLKQELDNGRPLIYSGNDGSGTGHAFNIDGYDNSDYFHLNWGWNGTYNGNYKLDALVPGTYDFSYNNGAVFNIVPMDHSPSDINLDNDIVMADSPPNTLVGVISTVDPDAEDEFIYDLSCVIGILDFKDCPFYISNDSIFTERELDVEEKSFTIRIKSTDSYNCSYSKDFVINIIPFNTAPSDILLSDTVIYNNSDIGSLIGSFETTDSDINDTHSYNFSNECLIENQNRLFEIAGNELYNRYSFASVSDTTFKICIESTDGYSTITKRFNILVINSESTGYTNIDQFESVKIYPNPTSSYITISALQNKVQLIKIYNILGNIQDVIKGNCENTTIDLSDYNSGVYIVNIELDNGQKYIYKILKRD